MTCVISLGGIQTSQNHSRVALAWSAIAVCFVLLTALNIPSFGTQSFYAIASLRLSVSLLAAIVALLSLAERAPSSTQTRVLFCAVVVAEFFCGVIAGKLSSVVLFLFAIAFAALLNVKRDQRLQIQSLGRGLKPTIRRQRDLIYELREAADRLKDSLNSGEREIMQASNHFSEGLSLQGLSVTKSNGPVVGAEEVTQACSQLVDAKRAKYLGKKRVHLVLSATRRFDIPVQIMIDTQDLAKMIGTCIDYAANSLSGGEGLVRVSVTTGLRHVTLAIEDNGYGINEEKLSASDTDEKMSFAQMRGLAAFWGARLVRNARLGVGSRVVLELPRVDAFVSEGRTPETTPVIKRSKDLEMPLG